MRPRRHPELRAPHLRCAPRSDLRRLLQDDARETPPTFSDLTACIAAELLFATGMRICELAGLPDRAVDLAGRLTAPA